MGLSHDPVKRERQLANLRPNANGSHGVYDARRLAPLERDHLAALRERYPAAPDRALATEAQRAAAIDLAWQWMVQYGVAKGGARGEVVAVVQLWRRLLNDSDAARRELEAQRTATPDPGSTLSGIVAELTEGAGDE